MKSPKIFFFPTRLSQNFLKTKLLFYRLIFFVKIHVREMFEDKIFSLHSSEKTKINLSY